MITLTAKIDILSGDNANLSIVGNKPFRNNISSDLGVVVGVKKQTDNPFILGSSRLSSGATFNDGVDYFIGDLADEYGDLGDNYFYIVDKSKSITALTIVFDTANNRHPLTIFIDNNEYRVNNAVFTAVGLTASETHEIYIANWNTPKTPLVITGIYAEVSIEIDRRNLISIESSIFDRSDLKLPSFGIISNTGNVEFNDIDGVALYCAEALLLKSGLKCEIKLNNTLVENARETVGVFETDQWNYDNDSRVVSVSLKDDLEEWQDINVAEISYDPRNPVSQPFSWLYNHLWGITSQNYNMLAFNDLDVQTKEVLKNTYIKYPLLEAGNLWEQWTKLCVVCQLHIYKDKKGVIVCRYDGGN